MSDWLRGYWGRYPRDEVLTYGAIIFFQVAIVVTVLVLR